MLLMRTVVVSLVLVAVAACAAPDAEVGRVPSKVGGPGRAPDRQAGVAPEAAPAQKGPVRVRYELGEHVARAELRRGETLVVDLGVPGGDKYTLGGWQSGVGPSKVVHGATAHIAEGVTARFLLPSGGAGAATLWVRATAFAKGKATLYLNGEAVAYPELPSDRFETVRVSVEAGKLAAGENLLQVRVPKIGEAPGVGRAGFAVDWFALGPAGEGDESEALTPPAPDALAVRRGDFPALAIPEGWSLGYAFEIPAEARLRGVVTGKGAVQIRAVGERGAAADLGRFAAREKGRSIDLDLSALTGVTRLDLSAEGGAATLVRPAVVTPEEKAPIAEVRKPKNVFVYLIDTLRSDKLSVYNAESRVKTPGMDAYAKNAAVFELAHTQENWTKPSVATLLSGLMPWEHHAVDGESKVPRSVTLLPELLGEKGFFTGAFIANGYVSGKFGFERGWKTWRNYIREGRRTPAEFVAKDVVSWFERVPEDKPFFLYVQTIDPHVPYIPPDRVLKQYDPEPYGGRVSFVRDRTLLEKVKTGRMKLDERDRKRLESLHDAEITYHDEYFAAIMKALEDRGLAEDTVVVVTADHGEEFFDHGSVGHGHSVWEELLHVPLLVRLPGVTDGGMRIQDSAGLVDVMPTLLEALGMEPEEPLSGRSLLPLLAHRNESAPRYSVSGFMEGWRALSVGRLKLIQRGFQNTQLYDLAKDPGETRDVAAERPLTVRYLRGLLGLTLASADAPSSREASNARGRRGAKGPSGAPRKKHQAENTDIDPETEAQLRALGYVGSSRR